MPLFRTGHAFAAGSRVRVSVSASYWPWMWPSPEPVTVTVLPEGGTLRLPERPADPARDGGPPRTRPPRWTSPRCPPPAPCGGTRWPVNRWWR
ncbi:CocE/NonD family hydrolase C-terminal non-catalytic domain-containing protein [Streptomyces cacaoi]|uniref:CocE/NonD family hydrolase C-terminal non-catalytic domain-containing protein n=1 Tax=Streptomyces cacaoi TaxID=1898 RepID=UPI00399FFB90